MKHCQSPLLLLFFLLSGLLTAAQDTAFLSLKELPDDTAKVNNLLAYGRTAGRTDSEKGKVVLKEAMTVAQRIHDENGLARATLNLGYINFSAGNYDECMQQFRSAMALFRKTKNIKEMCGAQLDLAAGFTATGDRDSALYYNMAALRVLETQPFIRERTRAYLNLGTIYNNLKTYSKAIEYQDKALALAAEAKDTTMLLNTYSALSLSYDNLGNKKRAFDMAQAALPYLNNRSNKAAACRIYNQYAHACIGVGRYDDAITVAQKAMVIANEISDINHYGSAAATLAKAHAQKGNHKQTIVVLDELARYSKEANNAVEEEVYELLAEAYYKTGNYRKAADAYSILLPMKDSIFNNQTNEMIAEQEVTYKTAQKEQQLSANKLQLAQKDLQLQKNRYYMYYTITALVVAILISALLYIRARHKKRLHQQELKAIQQQKELQLLQAMMQGEEKERSRIAKDLHDGVAGMLAAVKMHFSSMQGANDVMETEGYQQGMKLLNEATQEVRKTSHNLMPEVLIQHGVDEALRRYCNNVNNSRTLKIQYDSWGEIDRFIDSFELSIYRIVQELINNIIKHSKATQAMIQLTQQGELLSISIEDNGVGFSSGKSDGMGLRSLQSRIKAMNGKLELESSEQSGVSAYLEFDITSLKKELTPVYE